MMAEIIKCPVCSTENNAERYFCSKCGDFLKQNELSNASKCSEEEFKIKRIINNIPKTPHNEIFWNKTADEYCRKIERIKALFEVSGESRDTYISIIDQMKDFLDTCKNPEYQIAFVGTIKTGKSTLINALLGKNYASMAVTPETAALTKFRKSPKDYVHVSFYTDTEWKALWKSMSSAADTFLNEYLELNGDQHKAEWINHEDIHIVLSNDEVQQELSKWSSSQSPEHYFVKEIEVGISTLPNNFPPEVVFVDTPGLSDPVAYRSNITKNYIKKANAVFVCVDAQKINKEEIETIASVFSFSAHNKKKVHIIATHWDTMNQPVEDWEKQKQYLRSKLCSKVYFDTIEDAESNIMPSAAFIYNICRDIKLLNKNEKNPLYAFLIKMYGYEAIAEIDEYLPILKKMTNIDNIRTVINDRLVSRHSELMLQDLTKEYKNIMLLCRRYVETSKQDADKIVSAANSNLETLEKQLDSAQKDFDKIVRSQEMLNAALTTVKKKTETRLNGVLTHLEKLYG
jgi:Predicted GTPases